MARRHPHLWFHEQQHQSAYLRCTLRGIQVVAEEDAEEEYHHYSTIGHLIRLYRVG